MTPYTETQLEESVFVRTFSANTHWSEFKWHWDEEDRIVEPLNENDWRFQFDNQLPIKIYKPIHIPAGEIHRVIPGTTDLVVKIKKVK